MVRPGTASDLSRNSGTQKEWITSLVWIRKSTGRSFGSTSSVDFTFSLGVLEAPGELLPDDVDDELVRLLGLEVVEHDPAVDRERGDHQERDRHPDDLEPRVAVDRRAVAHVAGLGPEAHDAVDRDRHHEHEDRHRADQQDVVDGVDLVRRARPRASGTSRSAARSRCPPARPPPRCAIIRATGWRSPAILGSSSGGPAGGAGGWVPLAHRRASVSVRARRYRADRSPLRRRLAQLGEVPAAGRAQAGRRVRRGGGGRPSRTGRAGGSRPPWRPSATGSAPSSQQLGRARHAHALELGAEARPALAEDALELAAGGRDRVRDGAPATGPRPRSRARSPSAPPRTGLAFGAGSTGARTGVYVRKRHLDVPGCGSAGLRRLSLVASRRRVHAGPGRNEQRGPDGQPRPFPARGRARDGRSAPSARPS